MSILNRIKELSSSVGNKLKNYLPLSGGTITGILTVLGQNDEKNSQNVVIGNTLELSKQTSTSGFEISGGTKETTGAFLQLFGNDTTARDGTDGDMLKGRFRLVSWDKDSNHHDLYSGGEYNNNLSWNGKPIETIDSTGYVGSSGYVRYTGGLQICWGVSNCLVTDLTQTVTFPKEFKDTQYTVNITITGITSLGDYTMRYDRTSNAYFTQQAFKDGSPISGIGAKYIAIGFWK